MDVFTTTLKQSISKTPEFEKKRLASFAVNVGTKCGHNCLYCSIDVIEMFRDRVTLGISLTGTVSNADIITVIEPYASSLAERFAAMKLAHQKGLRTYLMLCPLLPSIADDISSIRALVRFGKKIGAEEVFAEAVNPRGNGLKRTAEALLAGGYGAESEAINAIRTREKWSKYCVTLAQRLQQAMLVFWVATGVALLGCCCWLIAFVLLG